MERAVQIHVFHSVTLEFLSVTLAPQLKCVQPYLLFVEAQLTILTELSIPLTFLTYHL